LRIENHRLPHFLVNAEHQHTLVFASSLSWKISSKETTKAVVSSLFCTAIHYSNPLHPTSPLSTSNKTNVIQLCT